MARILVAEDDESMNQILVTTLSDAEHEVTGVFSGSEALEKCRAGEFDLLVTDVRMPGMDGIETIKEMKLLCKGLRCIVITGYASQDTPVRAIRLNVDDYLFKPFSLKYFLNSVDQVLSRESERQEKNAMFSRLFSRFGLSMGNRKDEQLREMVIGREDAFRGLYVGIRSAYLSAKEGAEIYTRLEKLETPFRRAMNSPETSLEGISKLQDSYAEIHERLALLEIGAEMEKSSVDCISSQDFAPLFHAIKDSKISFEELLYAPLLRQTPDTRFETLEDLLELKARLWPQ